MTNIKAILFDLDGTLIDTSEDFHSTLNQLLKENNEAEIDFEEVRKTVSSGARALVKIAFNIEENHKQFESLRLRLLELYSEQIKQTRSTLFDGIEPLLVSLNSHKLLWGVVTNKPSVFTLPLLKNLNLLDTCATVICPNHVNKPKPDPEPLLMACKEIAYSPEQTIYIGDHPRDIEAGRNAGMRTLGAAYGFLPLEPPISKWQADYIVESASEIAHWLDLQNN